MAHLLFTASIKTAIGAEIILKVQSQPIYLSTLSTCVECVCVCVHVCVCVRVINMTYNNIITDASHEPPEIHRVVPQYGCPGDIIAVIGTRMHSRK